MGIQFKQIDNLQSTFDDMSGNFEPRISGNTELISGITSGDYSFEGYKIFSGNTDFSGHQGILVDVNDIYTPNDIFAGAVKIGYAISTPRNSTPSPEGKLQVSGGQIHFEDQLNIGNDSNIVIENGAVNAGTGNIDYVSGETAEFNTGAFDYVSGSTAEFSGIVMSGDLTGFLRLYDLPDYTATGDVPIPTSGVVFRSGNHLMII